MFTLLCGLSLQVIGVLSVKNKLHLSDINSLSKQHGQCCKGSKAHKISKLCEIYGFSSGSLV